MMLVPQSQWGIVVLSNEGGLPSLLAGTVENIAGGVMNMLVGQEPPASGPSLGTIYLIIDSIVVLITVFVLWSILRLPRWYEKSGRRWRQASRLKRGFKLAGVGLRLVWELILPALLLGLPLLNSYLTWRTLFINAPDIVTWLLVILTLLLITGIIRVVLMVRVLRRAGVDRPAVTTSPASNLASPIV
jgi:membrane protease YdiL (CAAX protease family)